MTREDLRPVLYRYNSTDGLEPRKYKGWFHEWGYFNDKTTKGIIETGNGGIIFLHHFDFEFINKKEATDKEISEANDHLDELRNKAFPVVTVGVPDAKLRELKEWCWDQIKNDRLVSARIAKIGFDEINNKIDELLNRKP